ncbi:MAG: DEAD/DEAH box helicase [Proteobacteria bacterium]|nr:DEAD/DEAH box helicase [Pseudomonadota bacterium]MBU1738097.1 DEAD/DEAH box helicase [Pseudomonadota bacterium]
MNNRSEPATHKISTRQKLLDSPVHILPLSTRNSNKLVQMGFKTVREAFRAALAGRLYSRKLGGADFENMVLEAGCTILGHPVFNRNTLKSFHPLDCENTFADVLCRFSGQEIDLNHDFMPRSVRDILLPSAMHNTVEACGIKTLKDLLLFPAKDLALIDGDTDTSLGPFLAHVFDFIFILNGRSFDCVATGNALFRQDEAGSSIQLADPSSLSDWPHEEMLSEGSAFLEEHPPETILFFRNAAGAIFTNGAGAASACITFTQPRSAGRHSFEFSDGACDLCPNPRNQRKKCCHVAALALRLLHGDDSSGDIREPLPLFFMKTPWPVIARILFEMFGHRNDSGATVCMQDNSWQLSIPGPGNTRYARMNFDAKTAGLAGALFGDRLNWHTPPPELPDPARVVRLQQKLLELGRNEAEAELNALGKRTHGQERDESVWMWLASRMCQQIDPKNTSLEGPGTDTLFTFSASGGKAGEYSFRMTVPRAKTPDLVDALANCGKGEILLPAAMAITRITMDEDGAILVSPQLALTDGRILARSELEEQLYGRYYYLPGEGFLPVKEQSSEHTIAAKKNRPRKFSADLVPGMIETHRGVFTAPENEIDPDLTELKIQETPDVLEVSSFSSDLDWCYLSGSYGIGNRRISLTELLNARTDNRKYLPAERNWLKLNDSALSWFHNLGEERLWANGQTGDKGVRLTRREMLMLSAIIPDLQMAESARGRDLLDQLLQTDRWIENDNLAGMPEHLRKYQKHGAAWLNQIYHNRLAGILADDMGLGKTHQALALMSIILKSGNLKGRFLVVCPATVVPHWAEKIKAFFPDLTYYIYHGSRRDLVKASQSKIFITTYGIMRRDTKALSSWEFELIFFDEIQQVKNKKTDVHKAASMLNSKVVIGLTGTPLENSVYDLKAIFDICLPGYLGSDHDFRTRFGDPIEEDNSSEARESLTRIINPFLLRRTREQVLIELPEVIEDFRICKLSEDQISLYRELISGRGREILEMVSPEQGAGSLPYMELLAVINYLKQICNHPCLIKKCTDPDRFRSGKWDLFLELLHECLDSSMKVVVFSHYTKMLDIIETYLAKNHISYCNLRGDMPISQRHEMIRKFNSDDSCKVFSASLLAGGVGVDLTAAQAVIHYDRWWNAAREDQATARVHRMGQKNVVQVFKLITEGTLEEKIHTMITRKRELANHMVREDDSAIIKRLSREELIDLLSSAP